MRAVNFSQNIWPLPQNHGQTREANTVMSTIQLSAWMFPTELKSDHNRANLGRNKLSSRKFYGIEPEIHLEIR
jgi:hypothetical protein